MSGRLFGSITYQVAGGALTIGTDVAYAAVQQFGSRDYMGGAAGPRTREQMMDVGPYAGLRMRAIHYRLHKGKNARGKAYQVPEPMESGMHEIEDSRGRRRKVSGKFQGPKQQISYTAGGHNRRQNIPARPFLVFRPEDPGRMADGIEVYLRGKAVKIGKVSAA